jgi:lipopolysaccharide biosynthesis glycosyltransferase
LEGRASESAQNAFEEVTKILAPTEQPIGSQRAFMRLFQSTVCIADDREASEPCLKLLLASLSRHCPGMGISLFYPFANQAFLRWVNAYPQVQVQADRLKKDYGWNVKPQAIMQLLDSGFDEVIWIDSDVLVTRDIRPLFHALDETIFVATEHTPGLDCHDHDRAGLRAQLWQLSVGRVLPAALNSGVLRATRRHYALMERWWELLQSDAYQSCQQQEWRTRPIHMAGDQDVLTALLTSSEFAHVPLRTLRRGKHIVQFDGVWGYTTAERTRNLLGDGPTFIHSIGGKPWVTRWGSERPRHLGEYLKMVYLDVSPYTLSSAKFKQELRCDTNWMCAHYKLSSILRLLAMQHPALSGLPIAVFADIARFIKRARVAVSTKLGSCESAIPISAR